METMKDTKKELGLNLKNARNQKSWRETISSGHTKKKKEVE